MESSRRRLQRKYRTCILFGHNEVQQLLNAVDLYSSLSLRHRSLTVRPVDSSAHGSVGFLRRLLNIVVLYRSLLSEASLWPASRSLILWPAGILVLGSGSSRMRLRGIAVACIVFADVVASGRIQSTALSASICGYAIAEAIFV